ncbi:MAG: polysaccharide deacetylase family protein [Candidatus Rokubacteria bacterium]|nr:polysaccharide deacetylase family protein [Candidatus Rokubacteria bacterium]
MMILEYHLIEEPEARWARTPANFRRDLERLRAQGYRLVGLTDYIAGRIALPSGTTPVILTFDDSSPGQLRFSERNGKVEVDPSSAVGIMEAFAREHPEFGLKATFYVLPGAKQPHKLFGQPEHEQAKLEYLVKRGFEIGNHTLWHANLAKYPEATVRQQLARAQAWVERLVPSYRLRTLALPMGAYPSQLEWAIRGSVNGTQYAHEAILMVAGGAAPSSFHRKFDPYHLPRIQATEPELQGWLKHFQQTPGDRYVSDGDPTTVRVRKERVDQVRQPLPAGLRLVGEAPTNPARP